MILRLFHALLCSALLVFSYPAHADDVSEGRDYYLNQCLACHAFACNRDGHEAYSPKLGGLFGRKAGGVEDFTGYTDGLKNSQIIWTDATLDDYLRDPSNIEPNSLMVEQGIIKDAAMRRKVIAFLKTEDPSVDLFCH